VKWNNHHHNHVLEKKKALDYRTKRRLRRAYEIDLSATLSNITADSQLNVHPNTVGNALREMNYYVHFSRKKPYLSRANKKERLRFARTRRKWSKEVWRGCIYISQSENITKHKHIKQPAPPKLHYKSPSVMIIKYNLPPFPLSTWLNSIPETPAMLSEPSGPLQ
jgi:Transposase